MSTLINLICFILFALGTFLFIQRRNQRNQKKSKSYLKVLVTQGPDVAEVKRAVNMRLSTMPLSSLSSPELLFNTTYGDLGKFKVQYQQKIDGDKLFLVTESDEHDTAPQSQDRLGKNGLQYGFQMHRFVVRINTAENIVEIYSDINETLTEKLVKLDFARELFRYLENERPSEIRKLA